MTAWIWKEIQYLSVLSAKPPTPHHPSTLLQFVPIYNRHFVMELKCNASFWTLFSCLPRFCSLLQKMSAKHPGDLINFRIFSEEIQKKTIRETDQEERRRIQLVQKEALSNGSCQSPNIADVIVITLLFKKPHTITNSIHTCVFFYCIHYRCPSSILFFPLVLHITWIAWLVGCLNVVSDVRVSLLYHPYSSFDVRSKANGK